MRLHENLKWTLHVASFSNKCFAAIASIAALRETGAGLTLLVRVYRALFEPNLVYCAAIWETSQKNVLHAVQVLQNSAISAIKRLLIDSLVSK